MTFPITDFTENSHCQRMKTNMLFSFEANVFICSTLFIYIFLSDITKLLIGNQKCDPWTMTGRPPTDSRSLCDNHVKLMVKQVRVLIGLQIEYQPIKWASSQENLSSGFPSKRVSNWSPQLQRLARKLKVHL